MSKEKVFCKNCDHKRYFGDCFCPELAKDSYDEPNAYHPKCRKQNAKNDCKHFKATGFFQGWFK